MMHVRPATPDVFGVENEVIWKRDRQDMPSEAREEIPVPHLVTHWHSAENPKNKLVLHEPYLKIIPVDLKIRLRGRKVPEMVVVATLKPSVAKIPSITPTSSTSMTNLNQLEPLRLKTR
jgi:hypothetical protein